MAKHPKNSQLLRLFLQTISLLLSAVFLFFIIKGAQLAIHAICPYASICFGFSKSALLGLAPLLFWLSVALGMLILMLSMFIGRKFCGYICPLGTIQEAVFSLRSRKYRTRNRVPYYLERRFASLKYFVLGITALLSALGFAFIFIRICPIYALSMLPRLAIPGLVLFLLIIIAGLFLERFWCRYLCPYAALLNIFQALGKLFGFKRIKIRRNLERCVDCGVCMLYCPMNLNIAQDEYVHDSDCIHCLVCATKCPKPGTFGCQKEES